LALKLVGFIGDLLCF